MNFFTAADAYDRFMGRWSSQLAPEFVDFAGLRAGDRAVDIGCGPGSLTAELVAAAQSRHPGVHVTEAAAEALPFPDGCFDTALAQLVVHFMRDPVAGVAEMARVTREGGVVAACVWNYAHARGPLGPFWDVARELDATVVDESNLAGTRRGHLARIFADAGVREVEEGLLSVAREYDSFDDWWQPFTLGVGPGGAYVARLTPHQAADLRDHCRSRLPVGAFALEAEAWAVRGRRRSI